MGRRVVVTVAAGERCEVIRRFGGSIPSAYTITVVPTGGGAVGGTLEVRGSRWIWWKPVETLSLRSEQTVVKGFWDTRFSVVVVPDVAVEVIVEKG